MYTVSKFVDKKLAEEADSLEDRIRIQNYVDKLEKLFEINQKKFNKEQCNIISLRWNNQIHKCKLRNNWLGCGTVKKRSGSYCAS